jgi:hypothetical protein
MTARWMLVDDEQVVVPREPTHHMIIAGLEACSLDTVDWMRIKLCAAISVAPAQPGPVTREEALRLAMEAGFSDFWPDQWDEPKLMRLIDLARGSGK